MKNWKDSLATYCRQNKVVFAMPITQVETFIEGIVKDMVTEFKVQQTLKNIEVEKNKILVQTVESMAEELARLKLELKSVLSQRTLENLAERENSLPAGS